MIPADDRSLIRVQCDFITGSNAQGCMVVFVGDFNETLNLTRSENASDVSETYMFNLQYTISCFEKVLAYDIERDGSIGSLAIYGVLHIVNNAGSLEDRKCLSDTSKQHSISKQKCKMVFYFINLTHHTSLNVTPLLTVHSTAHSNNVSPAVFSCRAVYVCVTDRPYFFVVITRLLKDNLRCLVNKQPKTEDKKK